MSSNERSKNQAEQFQWALDHCDVQTDWVLRIDADEYLEPGLASEIQETLPTLPGDVDGIYIKRKVVFMGRWIRYGGVYPLIVLRLWRTGKGRIEQRWMDEHSLLPSGTKTVIADGQLVDDNRKGITFWIDKHNKYASREMVELLNIKYPLFERDEGLKTTNDRQAKESESLKTASIQITGRIKSISLFYLSLLLAFGFLRW